MRPFRAFGPFAAALVLLAATLGRADAPPFSSPLQPIDTSSPRATVEALAGLGRELDTAYAAYLEHPTFAGQRAIREVLANTSRLFDLSETSLALQSETAVTSFGLLKDILMRLPAIDPAALPGDAGTAPERTRLPGTDIAITHITEGPHRGSFEFSADTVEQLPAFHARIIDLPVLRPAPYESWHAEQVRFTGPLVPGALVRAMPEPLEALVLGTPAWKLIASLLLIGLAIWIGFVWAVFALGRAAAARPIPAQLWRLGVPAASAILALAVRAYLLGQVNVTGTAFQIVQAFTLGVVVLAAALAVRAVIALLGELVIAAPGVLEKTYDIHLLRLVTRVTGLAAGGAVIVYGANSLGVPILGLVAGVGVGGLALALAAQSTVENLFGGVSIFADRPFRVGDFIIFAGGKGYVESIGPRSTRIRADDGMEIIVPNADLAKMQVTNKSRRDATLFEHRIGFTYDATEAELTEFTRRMRAALDTYPLDPEPPIPPRVRIIALSDSSIDVQVHAELLAESEDDFFRLQERLLLEMIEVAHACGLSLAFPTQTLQLARTKPVSADGQTALESIG